MLAISPTPTLQNLLSWLPEPCIPAAHQLPKLLFELPQSCFPSSRTCFSGCPICFPSAFPAPATPSFPICFSDRPSCRPCFPIFFSDCPLSRTCFSSCPILFFHSPNHHSNSTKCVSSSNLLTTTTSFRSCPSCCFSCPSPAFSSCVNMLETFVNEVFLQLSSPPLGMAIALVLLGAFLQFSRRRKGDSKIKIKSTTGDSACPENIAGKLGNLDQAPARRRARAAFQKELEKLEHPFFQESLDGVTAKEYYEVNSRGIEIFTRSWLPESGMIKATVFICHGYGDTCTFFFEGVARKLAKAGYAVFGMDYPGFGLTSGLHGFVPKFNKLVDDVIENYSKIKARPEFRKLPCFLFGESMGGAVSLKAHLKQPEAWNGAVLVAPMCRVQLSASTVYLFDFDSSMDPVVLRLIRIAADMYPPWPLLQILIVLAYLFPRAKLVPEKNLADMAFRDIGKRQQTAYNVVAYKDRPRLKTALELLKATEEISSRLNEVALPLLILHGERDIVTDPSVSKALHEQAKSADKTLHIYEEAWHSILEGEPDEVILQAFNDIRSWLDSHTYVNNGEYMNIIS